MSKSKFRTISLPHNTVQTVEKYIEQSNGLYVSIAEVVREALREYFVKNQKQIQTS
jgi:Arc/MetJ-type ribon-helix-helix transcriptional regulator